jgi:hypothetical protein
METVGQYLVDHQEFDIFSIHEEERIFQEVGIHTVIMDRGEFMVIDVHECGGFTILEQHFS